jgi:5-methylthioadenosine/S-adenosylhomocysteine deaminase
MEKADFILKAGYVLTVEDDEPITDGAVAIREGTILDVGRAADISKKYSAERTIGGNGRVLLPGLVNTHTHAPMVYMRGIADDLPLKDWLEKHIWPLEEKWLGPEFIRDATELACLEMLKGGVTAYADMYFYEDAAALSVKKLGMRAVLGAGVIDFPTKAASTRDEYFARAESFIMSFLGDEFITPSIAPHSLYTCGPESQTKAAHMAEKFNVPLHTHLAETRWETEEIRKLYGTSPVRFLDGIGALSTRVIAAHCVWIDDEEIDIIARQGVGVSHCVESNLKLASGIAPVVKMLKAGVRVSFGTDGAASNNDLSILGEMSTAAKLHKAISGDPTALDARTVLKMATKWGAEAIGLGDKIGSIKKGKAADLVMIGLNRPHLTPMYNVYSHMVYAARPCDVETVMVGGRLVVDDGRLLTADEDKILANANEWAQRIKSPA